jgi:hypothetical protein
LFVVWQAATDAFPMSMDDQLVLIDADAPAKTVEQKLASAAVNKRKLEVVEARALVNGGPTSTSTTAAAAASTTSTGKTAGVPSIASGLAVSKIARQKSAAAVPTRAIVNHKIPIGKKGWRHDQSKSKINTADYELASIDRRLGRARTERYMEARRSYRLWKASKDAASAAANMATSIRKEALARASRAVQRVSKLEAKLGVANSQAKSRIQMKLASARVKVKESHAYAIKAGQAANAAIMKVATLVGQAKAKMTLARSRDTSTRMENALEEADKAKLALKTFDQNTANSNSVHAAMKKAKKAREAEHAAYIKKIQKLQSVNRAADKAERDKAFMADLHQANKHISVPKAAKTAKPTTTAYIAPASAASTTSVQKLVAKAHATGKSADVKAAAAAVSHKVAASPHA